MNVNKLLEVESLFFIINNLVKIEGCFNRK